MSRPVTIDTIEINSLVVAWPERVLAVLECKPVNGLWQLTLSDPETRDAWRLGHYIDHYETREVELRDELWRERWPEWPDTGSDVIAWRGRRVAIRATGDRIRVEIGAWRLEYLRLCPFVQHTLEAPVFLGTTVEGRYFMLDCISGWRKYPGSLEGLEGLVKLKTCRCGRLHWLSWHVVRGGETVEMHYGQAKPRAVIKTLRRVLGP